MTSEQVYQVEQFALDVQMAAYDHFDVDCCPLDDDEYDEMVEYIIDMTRKTNWVNLLTEECVDIADSVNAHMAADAFDRIVNG